MTNEEKEIRDTLFNNINKNKYEVFLFGSRAV
jgi:hypothetical protein